MAGIRKTNPHGIVALADGGVGSHAEDNWNDPTDPAYAGAQMQAGVRRDLPFALTGSLSARDAPALDPSAGPGPQVVRGIARMSEHPGAT